MMLPEEQKRKGVIAASAGNHALALAYHGGLLSKYKFYFKNTASPRIARYSNSVNSL